MADSDQNNDEYRFTDLDVIGSESAEEETTETSQYTPRKPLRRLPDVKRNALIAVGVLIIFLLLYKYMGSLFHVRPKSNQISTPPSQPAVISQQAPPTQAPQPTSTLPMQQPQQPVMVQQSIQDTSQLNQRISSLESNQQNIRTDFDTLNNQVSGLSANVDDLNTKIATLNQMVSVLTARVEQQMQQIALLTAKTAKPKVVRAIIRRATPVRSLYYIQAVIPGRAWLISANGTTLTVGEGSSIPGYGVVKLIDPNQGRVVTSSGRVIKFSQQDS